MTATVRSIEPRFSVRLTGAALAALITLGVVSSLSQSLHVERFGAGVQVVQLERVTITGKRPAAAPAVAAAAAATRTN